MAREFEGPTEGMRRDVKKMQSMSAALQSKKARESYASDNVDAGAFNSMQKATAVAPDRLFENKRMFAESEYNMNASNAERGKYDSQAYFHLQALYHEDKKKKRFETFSFPEYLQNLDNKYLEEKFIHARDDDPEYYKEAGNLLHSIYEGDADQLKLSAYNVYSGIGTTDEPSKRRDRSNISVESPEASSY